MYLGWHSSPRHIHNFSWVRLQVFTNELGTPNEWTQLLVLADHLHHTSAPDERLHLIPDHLKLNYHQSSNLQYMYTVYVLLSI